MMHKAIALTASLCVASGMWITFAAFTAPHVGQRQTGYSIDRLHAAEGCVAGQPVYHAPDGRLWTWRGDWTEVQAEARGACDVQAG